MHAAAEASHYSADFVAAGGHRAVAEALNEGQSGSLRRVVDRFVGGSVPVVCMPLHVYAERSAEEKKWHITSLRSPEEWEASLRRLARRRSLREALLRHGGAELERVHRALERQTPHITLVVRLVVVLGDESSHVNALVVRGGEAELFEPKLHTEDTPCRPFGAVRAAVASELCGAHTLRLSPAQSPAQSHAQSLARSLAQSLAQSLAHPPARTPRLVLQTDDDLCQTWIAMYVVERLRTPTASFDDVLRRLAPSEAGCDRLCAVLRFSRLVYTEVPFPRTTRRGTTIETLAKRCTTTSRHFSADPAPCGQPRAHAKRSGRIGRGANTPDSSVSRQAASNGAQTGDSTDERRLCVPTW